MSMILAIIITFSVFPIFHLWGLVAITFCHIIPIKPWIEVGHCIHMNTHSWGIIHDSRQCHEIHFARFYCKAHHLLRQRPWLFISLKCLAYLWSSIKRSQIYEKEEQYAKTTYSLAVILPDSVHLKLQLKVKQQPWKGKNLSSPLPRIVQYLTF